MSFNKLDSLFDDLQDIINRRDNIRNGYYRKFYDNGNSFG